MYKEQIILSEEEKEGLKELLDSLGVKNLCIVEVQGDFTADQVDSFINQCVDDCIQNGLL